MISNLHNSFQWMKKSVGKIRDFFLAILGFICLIFGIYMAWQEKIPSASLLFTAGIFLCILSSLSRFESFKGLGIEAKMTALDNKMDEADRLLIHIRDIVGLTANISFQLMARIGRWDAEIPMHETRTIAADFKKQLRALGETDAAINKRMAPWHESNIRDLVEPIYLDILEFIRIQNQKLTQETRDLAPDLPSDHPERLRLNNFFDKNSAYIQQIGEQWLSNVNGFAADTDKMILESPSGSPAELTELISRLRPQVDAAKHYVTYLEFRD
jgi:hypothetical protein